MQLIVFHACLSAGTTAEGRAPFTGLAPRLIRLGLPASVAMQDFVEMEDARVFFSEFYRALLDEGLVDVAVNRGRQRLVSDPRVDNWSIPALFSRLRGGRLWCADPIREAIANVVTELPRDSPAWPPLQVIEHTRGVAAYKPIEGASGPRLDLWKRASELAATPGSFTILTGSRGSLISAQLRRLFRTTATLMLSGASAGPWPVFLTLAELSGRGTTSWPILQRIWSGAARPDDDARLEGRRFLFLIDGEEELTGVRREHALAAINRLRELPGSAVFLLADELLDPGADAGTSKRRPCSSPSRSIRRRSPPIWRSSARLRRRAFATPFESAATPIWQASHASSSTCWTSRRETCRSDRGAASSNASPRSTWRAWTRGMCRAAARRTRSSASPGRSRWDAATSCHRRCCCHSSPRRAAAANFTSPT